MLGLLIFNHLNDILYMHGDINFLNHIRTLSASQGLSFQVCNEDNEDSDYPCKEPLDILNKTTHLDPNIVIQLFSPLVTSQHLMAEQFGNSYSTIFCEDGSNIVFQEHRGFLFIVIGTRSENFLKRYAAVAVMLVQFTVGLCVGMLKSHPEKSQLLDKLVSAWLQLYSLEQCYLVEAIERLVVNPSIAQNIMSTLSSIVDKLKKSRNVSHAHAIFFSGNKLLSLYSSENIEDLSGGDLLLLNLLTQSQIMKDEPFSSLSTSIGCNVSSPISDEILEDFESDEESNDNVQTDFSPRAHKDNFQFEYVKVFNLLLSSPTCQFTPHIVYLYPIGNNLSLAVVTQVLYACKIGAELLKLTRLFESIKNEEVKPSGLTIVENIETSLYKSRDLMKELPRSSSLKARRKLAQVSNHWESAKKSNIDDWVKTSAENELPSRIEACISSATEASKSTWQSVCLDLDISMNNCNFEEVLEIVKNRMGDTMSLLEPSTHHSMPLTSRSILSVNKYLEEFPGLVHFLYIDRSTHQMTAPTIWLSEPPWVLTSEEKPLDESSAIRLLTCTKIWSMVNFARENLSKGHTSLIWKDKTFNYSYFLWFEDTRGNPMKPLALTEEVLEILPIPGIICGDFYSELTSKLFPSEELNKVKIYELFCIHLGLTTSPCILEQTRRLAATIWEITGPTATNPVDLL